MNHLKAVNKYFWKHRWRFLLGFIFIIVSNYFGILAPQVTGYVVDLVTNQIQVAKGLSDGSNHVVSRYDPLVNQFIHGVETKQFSFLNIVLFCGIVLLLLALLRGFFMFLMRQTIIVMSRHIEFDQKNEIFRHYEKLDTHFYRTHNTGDLMSRMAEDVSRVRMYTGPAIMYLVNLVALIGFSLFYMFRKDWELTLYVLSPLPILTITIYWVNTLIHRKSEHIQSQLSDLTTNAQESYSGIRVIKSFVQEGSMLGFFTRNSERYRESAINLAKVEAIYFPSIALIIGLSTLLTIYIGGVYQIEHKISPGTIAEFVVYINMLSFPVSALGWVASMIQRASASQKRLNEFLDTKPGIFNTPGAIEKKLSGQISFKDVSFTYLHTGIAALKHFDVEIKQGEKIAIVGRTGSGKSTIGQLLVRMFDPNEGKILIDGTEIRNLKLHSLREQIAYVPQDVFLFSETIANNIRFGKTNADQEEVEKAAWEANIHQEIIQLPARYETMIGERGVTLSGGQKQRLSIARALIKNAPIVLFDDCLSAVDVRTEKTILAHFSQALSGKTVLMITHRIFSLFDFDQIIVLEDGEVIEKGRHEELLAKGGYYAELYQRQQEGDTEETETNS